jgi:hypothetical protein
VRLTLLGLGLATATSLVGRTGAAQSPSRNGLAGRWTVTLRIDSSGTGQPATRALTGTMVVLPVVGSDPPTYRGTYQIPFSTIGLSPDAAPILLRVGRDDSVRIALNPTVDHGNVEMIGGWNRGALEGRWQWIGRPMAVWGRFTMRIRPR